MAAILVLAPADAQLMRARVDAWTVHWKRDFPDRSPGFTRFVEA